MLEGVLVAGAYDKGGDAGRPVLGGVLGGGEAEGKGVVWFSGKESEVEEL